LYSREIAISAASAKSGTRRRGANAASTVAQAKLVAECPDGNDDELTGGPSRCSNGRCRSVTYLPSDASPSEATSAASTSTKIRGRRQRIASTAASASQTSPDVPIHERATKNQSSHRDRSPTIQCSR